MTDHREEQEMEAEALEAIFDTAFEIRCSTQPFLWSVKLLPVDCDGDVEEEDAQNHVAIRLTSKLPLNYPEESLPEIDIEILKGLSEDNKKELLDIANNEAKAYEGMPAIYAVCEAVRAWLGDNNVKGLDDASMHAQMMRRAKEAERKEAQAAQQFESQKKTEDMSEAEKEEIAVRKRREEGTPMNDDTFAAWRARFEHEMKEKKALEVDDDVTGKDGKKGAAKDKKDDAEERLTGFQIFSGKSGVFNLEKLEAAAEEAANDTSALDSEELEVEEGLFDDDDEFDDLDFDDDEDDSDEEPDI